MILRVPVSQPCPSVSRTQREPPVSRVPTPYRGTRTDTTPGEASRNRKACPTPTHPQENRMKHPVRRRSPLPCQPLIAQPLGSLNRLEVCHAP
jgi:hypothetical protein